MDERHLHFNVLSALWMLVVIVVLLNLAKFVLNKYPVPGITDLVNNA